MGAILPLIGDFFYERLAKATLAFSCSFILILDFDERVSEIEGSWADTREIEAVPERKNIFLQLVNDITEVVTEFPSQAEPLILKSAILLTMAEDASSFVALGLVKEAKSLLQKAIGINPAASKGSALVSQGNSSLLLFLYSYFRLPVFRIYPYIKRFI
jgi:hypothetical protein